MSTPLVDIASLRAALAAGELILTANQRLARAVEQTWASERIAAGDATWPRPRVLALESWFERQWHELRDAAFEPALTGMPTSTAVELRLWRQIIAADPEPIHGDPATFAALAHSARQLLERWDLNPAALAGGGQGSERLADWLPRWRAAMARCGLRTREQCLETLLAAQRAGAIATAGRVHLLGFASLPPRYRRALTGLCREVIEVAAQAIPGLAQRYAASDPEADFATAAHWACERLAADPECRVAIVVPDLTARRGQIERALRDRLTPTHGLPQTAWTPPPYNLSAGQSLAELPLARSALGWLAFTLGAQPLGAVCRLLHDPHWGAPEQELELRVRLEHRLRDQEQVLVNGADLRQAAARTVAELEPPSALARRLEDAAALLRRAPRRAGFSAWIPWIEGYLRCLDWPGNRGLDSQEFQQLQLWRALLDEFAALAITGEEPSWPEAIGELRRLAAAMPFQPRTPDARLQVLGVLEAEGLRFDALWVCGLSDARWPEPLDPSPLLPVGLQHRLAMPRAQAAHELNRALARIAEFHAAAPEVIFSYPLRDGEVERQPFAAIRELPAAAITLPPPAPLLATLSAAARHQVIAWGDAPPCRAEELATGGSARLRDQSGCPFNAFAIWRLGARPLIEPEPGLSRALRGELVHRALELFWDALPDQQALLALDDNQRRGRLQRVIGTALDELARRRPELRGPRLRAVEADCLLRQLEAWMAVELARAPFAVIGREQRLHLDLEGLGVRLRIDRIDRLSDGRLLLLDYKTGAVRATGWGGERPEDPQLPLYALAAPGELAGLALARVRIDPTSGSGLLGIADGDLRGCRPLADWGLPANWPEAQEHWHRVLGNLAREFRAGIATIGHQHRASADTDPLIALNRLAEYEALHRSPVTR